MRKLMIGQLLLCAPLLAGALLGLPSAASAAKTAPRAPLVSTGGVKQARGSTATLLGAVNPHGLVTSYHFQYGPTVAYGSQTTPGSIPAGFAKVTVGQVVGGILRGYHYRLVASNASGSKNGRDRIYSPKKTTSSKFTLAKSSGPTVFGSPYTLTGTLSGTGAGNRGIELQASPFPFLAAFEAVGAPIVTKAVGAFSSVGAFSFHVASLSTTTQFRVNTLDLRPVYSPIVTQHVAVRVILKVRSSRRRGFVRLYGTVAPAEVGARVSFQLRKPARPGKSEKTSERTTKFVTQFTSSVKRGTQKVSRFSAIVRIRTGGRYRAYVQPKKGAVVAGSSATVLLHSASGSTVKAKQK
ncbi:MAG TPA: hypothetical protein VK538_08795 [Solirubrobacteraceae bacterium]|jgi:hypothetical protein|nr:hypothetical protein [Solirubrobacteraceae bacterium]